ncbi:MAG: DUF4418 family protein [Lachnospiraceae bacterium]|jgi:putative membrane protein|nr:MAG: DUF4418 family protein [Lachnospiraceae bacterium]
MLKNKDKVFALIFLILGAVLYFIPGKIASVCPAMPDGGFMKCHWTGEVIKALGVLIVIIAAVMLFNAFVLKKEGLGLGLVIANIAIGAFTMLTPLHIIGTCPNPMMHCNVATKPAILLVSGIFIVTNIIYIFLNKKN